MSAYSQNVSAKTFELVEKWKAAKNSAAELRRRLAIADAEERVASVELGRWLVPEEFRKRVESFNIWIGSGVLQATPVGDGYVIKWLKEPDGKDRLEHGV